jgi:signal peptidase I
VGLPGDRIQLVGGVLHLNGRAVRSERIADYVDRLGDAGARRVRQYRETLPGGVIFLTLDLELDPNYDDTDVFSVPEGSYFVLGDHRDNSRDSRFSLSQGGVGFVPAETLVGRVTVIFWNSAEMRFHWRFPQ